MPGVSIYERVFGLDVITTGGKCVGVLAVLNGRLTAFMAPVVVLASGGMGQLYALTTNPPISTGDGLAMAYRAGAVITDIEFVQFHPGF
jgi:L-aspartate oxidase